MSTDAIQYESLSGFTPPSSLGRYRAADYWKLPEGGPVELMGELVVSPAPDIVRQTTLGILYVFLFNIARRSGGRALMAPTDVVLDDHTILQPDLL